MIPVLILFLTLWIGLPILVEVITHLTTKSWLKLSQEPGFWEFMSGDLRLRPPAHFSKLENPVQKIHEVKSVRLTEDWELPTLERTMSQMHEFIEDEEREAARQTQIAKLDEV